MTLLWALMRIPVVVPKATISMEQATILPWIKGSGDPVEADDGAEHVVEFTVIYAPSGALSAETLQALNGVKAAREHVERRP